MSSVFTLQAFDFRILNFILGDGDLKERGRVRGGLITQNVDRWVYTIRF
jgi:hypothetical protein